MKKLYEKNELTFALVCIAVYCVLQSFANTANKIIGIEYSASAVLCIIQAIVLFVFIKRNKLQKKYGLCTACVDRKQFFYYIPLIILATFNLWNGVAVNDSVGGTVFHVICMLFVGFVEEVIFRGFLFKAIEKTNIKSAIIISSVTFGAGHLINLFNKSGMNLLSNLCQICFAIAIGFLFVTIFCCGKTLLPCIITHSVINITAAFADNSTLTSVKQIISCLLFTAITVAYTLCIRKMNKKTEKVD